MASLVCAETAHWEPGKVVAVEPVSVPAKTPDPDCKAMPRGQTIPARCRPDSLRAQQYWNVTVEVGNKRYVVRQYRAPRFIDTLNQEGPFYIDPNLTAGMSVEVAVYPNKTVRLRTDKSNGVAAMVDSDDVISRRRASGSRGCIATCSAFGSPGGGSSPFCSTGCSTHPRRSRFRTDSKIVLLHNGDFIDLEVQETKSQDIGDGAALYSFTGDSSRARVNSNKPVFMVLGGSDAGNPELSRLQVGKGTRELAYSSVRKKSASPVPVTVTKVSETLRRITVNTPLPAGEYVFLMPGSDRAFLFDLR